MKQANSSNLSIGLSNSRWASLRGLSHYIKFTIARGPTIGFQWFGERDVFFAECELES